MTDEEFVEHRDATRKQILALYDLPVELVAAWDAIDREDDASPVRPAGSEETTT